MPPSTRLTVRGKGADDDLRTELATIEAEVGESALALADLEWTLCRQGCWLERHEADHPPKFEERRLTYHRNVAAHLDLIAALDKLALRANALSASLLDPDAAYTCEHVIRDRWRAVSEQEQQA